MKRSIKLFIIALMAAFFCSVSFAGEGAPPQWWNMSPLDYPETSEFLHHVEAGYNFSHMEGMMEDTTHQANAKIVLRQNRFTNEFSGSYLEPRQKTVTPNIDFATGTVTYTEELYNNNIKLSLDDMLSFALTKNLLAAVGAMWDIDEARNIKNEYIYYGGFNWLDNFFGDRVMMDLLAAVYTGKLEYTDTYSKDVQQLQQTFPTTFSDVEQGEVNVDGYFLSQAFTVQVLPNLSLNESFSYMGRFQETSRYSWKLALGAAISITEHVSLTVNYTEDYDMNAQLLTLPRTKMFSTGINVSF